MIKKEFMACLSLFTSTIGLAVPPPQLVLLTPEALQLRGEVNDTSVQPIIDAIEKGDKKIFTLFIDSPGGNVLSGVRLLESVARTGAELHCVVGDQAASAAFFILQIGCKRRYVSDNSILLQHFWTITLPAGTLETHTETLRTTKIIFDNLRRKEAKRLEVSVEELMRRSSYSWSMYGEDAVKQKAADGVVVIKCSPELVKQVVQMPSMTPYGPGLAPRSGCPFYMGEVKQP